MEIYLQFVEALVEFSLVIINMIGNTFKAQDRN